MTPDPTACAPGSRRATLDPDGDCTTDLGFAPSPADLEAFLAEQGVEAPDTVSTVNYARVVTVAAQTLAHVLGDRHALLRTGHAQLVAAQMGDTLKALAEATRLLAQWLTAEAADGGCGPAQETAVELKRVAKGMDTVGERARRLAFPADRLPAMTPQRLAERVREAMTARGLAVGRPQPSPARVVWPLPGGVVLVLAADAEGPGGPWQLRAGGVDGHLMPLPVPQVTYVHPQVVAERVAAVLQAGVAAPTQMPPESSLPTERAVLWRQG